MNLIYPIAIICLLAITSCKKNEDSNINTTVTNYSISGYTKDGNNKGIPGVQIIASRGTRTLTDTSGFWTLSSLNGFNEISASKIGCSFLPDKISVYESKQGLLFQDKVLQSPHIPIVLNWMHAQQLPNGLVRSSFSSPIISLYDNALAACSFMAENDYTSAAKIFDYFNNQIDQELTVPPGGFSQFRNVNSFEPDNTHWLGDNAWLLIALNAYNAKIPFNPYQRLRNELTNWIRNLQNQDGSLSGGTNSSGNTILYVTEGNLDAFNAVLGYDSFHSKLLKYMAQNRFDATNKYLLCIPDNSPYRLSLDNFSWGYSTLPGYSSNYLDAANIFYTTKTATSNLATVSGYCFDTDCDAVWLEGTGQMAVAYQIAGFNNKVQAILREMDKMIIPSPSNPSYSGLPYATNKATGWGGSPLWDGADTEPCISSSAWYIMTRFQYNPFTVGRNKNIPTADIFWR